MVVFHYAKGVFDQSVMINLMSEGFTKIKLSEEIVKNKIKTDFLYGLVEQSAWRLIVMALANQGAL